MKPLKKYHRPNVFNHKQIIRDIDASPSKCIDKDIAKKHGCSESHIHTLRFRHTKVRFNTGIPRIKTKPNKDLPRINYLQKVRNALKLLPAREVCRITKDPIRTAKELLKDRGIYLSLQMIRDLEGMKGEGR